MGDREGGGDLVEDGLVVVEVRDGEAGGLWVLAVLVRRRGWEWGRRAYEGVEDVEA